IDKPACSFPARARRCATLLRRSPRARTGCCLLPWPLPGHVRKRPSHQLAENGWPPSQLSEMRVRRRQDPATLAPWRLSLRDLDAAADGFLPIKCRKSALEVSEIWRQFRSKSWANTYRREYKKALLSTARN